MSITYRAGNRCLPSAATETAYIYTIVPTFQNSLAAITSANELLVLDRLNLSESPILRLNEVPQGVTALVIGDDDGRTTMCCGSDGAVATHDIRTQVKATQFKTGDRALTALSRKGYAIALGTELANHQAVVSVWDQRQNKQIWQNSENSDDITTLDFHPSQHHMLLAGGDDGQVNIFDTTIAEEDDSIVQGLNHGPIHKAGFLGDHRFFALSSDQNLAIHPISSPGDEEDPPPTSLGDLRPVIPCEYVIDIIHSGDGYAVATGSNVNSQSIRITELRHASNLSKTPKLKLKSSITLEGAHGEEVVRSLFIDDITHTIFSAGEDGAVQAIQIDSSDSTSITSAKQSKTKKSQEGRYKPY